MEQTNKIIVFQEKNIRRIWHNEEWFYSIVDVIEILTDSPIPRTYWSKLKAKMITESQLNPNWVQLKLPAADGKNYKTDCANFKAQIKAAKQNKQVE